MSECPGSAEVLMHFDFSVVPGATDLIPKRIKTRAKTDVESSTSGSNL
jgi:hypothetical protein